MKPRKLYVIGNGFDLQHDIPSKLDLFKQYLRDNGNSVFREVEEYLPVREDWCDLEEALADMDVDAIIDNLGHFMASYGAEDWSDSGHHDFQFEVENLVKRLSSELRQLFGEWIRLLPIPTPTTALKRLIELDRTAAFLNFNYTSTLSTLYGIAPERILFIHGCAAQSDEELVLGHAWHPQNRRSLNDRSDIADIDTRLVEAHDILDGYFSTTFKPSEALIAKNQPFFQGLASIKQVFVLGHSLSDIDASYFQALLGQPNVSAAQWHIACRSLDEWLEKQAQLIRWGLNPSSARSISWESL